MNKDIEQLSQLEINNTIIFDDKQYLVVKPLYIKDGRFTIDLKRIDNIDVCYMEITVNV